MKRWTLRECIRRGQRLAAQCKPVRNYFRRRPRRLVLPAIVLVALAGMGLRWMLADQRGVASYYADAFHGRQTASGEPFDMYAMTAAHRKLPLGTVVLVKNRDNGRAVVVRINDRGPYVRGRIIDLSYGAARELDMLEAGLANVELERLDLEGGK